MFANLFSFIFSSNNVCECYMWIMDWTRPKGLDPMVESEEFFTVEQDSILVRALLGAMGTPWGSGEMCGCTQRYYIKWYRDVCTHKWIKSHPHVLQIFSPWGLVQLVIECVVKPLCVFKVTVDKKSIHAKCSCGSGCVQSQVVLTA